MKILIVITKSELGGAQNFVLNLARGLKAAGEEAVVGGGPGEYLPEELAKDGIAFHRFKNLERGRNPLKGWKFAAELKEYAAAEKFAVVHLNSTNALLGAWSLSRLEPKPRLVFTVHGLSVLDGGHRAPGPLKMAYRSFFKAAFKKLDALVFVSRLNLKFAAASGLLEGGTEAKSHLIYNGLDFSPDYLLNREEARRELAEKLMIDLDNYYVYGSIGRLAYPKNYEFLINAHKAVKTIQPQAKLLLIGEGPERIKYEGLIKSYQLEGDVVLSGEIACASRYLKAFDLFVLPSVFEGLSLSLLEATRAGIPSLATRVGGNEEIIGAEQCFSLNNQAEFLKLLSEIRENNSKNKAAGYFSENSMVKAYLELYQG